MDIVKKEIAIGGTTAHMARPSGEGTFPGLVVIEEIWGLTDHIKDVADRFAAEGFVVIAPELLPEGVLAKLTPQMQADLFDPAKRDEIQPKLREATQPVYQPEYASDALAKLTACVDALAADPGVDGKIGVVGFCFGGTYGFHLAAHDARVRAAIPFYGQPPAEGEIPSIACPILAFYGDKDMRLMDTLPRFKEDMAKHGKEFEAIVYENAGHAFFNDTNARTYRPENARDAWNRSLSFLKDHLK